jgi:hypothetical protein
MVTPRHYRTCRKTIGYLRRQTARELLELIIVAPSRGELEVDQQELACFHSYQVVEVGRLESTGRAMAAGVRAARADVVVYAEEHSFPEPDWARVLIEAHRQPYAAVGCAVRNANPRSLCSWANLFGQFGPAVAPVASGVTSFLAGHHSSYKREVLLAYGDRLGELLDNECALHIDLRGKGHVLYLAGEAISSHVNISRLGWYCRQDYLGQRGFAVARARAGRWSGFRRALYVAAAPLIPLVRLRRSVRDIVRSGRSRQLLPGVLFLIVPALVCGAVGEALGYVLGDARDNPGKKLLIELDRYAYVDERDRQRAGADPAIPAAAPSPLPIAEPTFADEM